MESITKVFSDIVKPYIDDEVSARAELGAHNWLILDDSLLRGIEGNDTSYTFLPTGIEVANATSGTFRVCSFWLKNLKQNTDYILSSDVTIVSGTGRMFVRDSDSSTFLCDTQNISNSKNVSLSFNTGTYTNLYIVFYSVTNTAAIGDVKYENLLIRLADDTSTEYQPYAMTNRELTDAVVPLLNRYSVLVVISESVTTVLELEQALFDATYGLLTNVGDTCDGMYTWAGHGRYKFSTTKTNTNDGQCWFSTNANMFIGTKTGSNYTCYQISGTAIN